MRRLLRFLTGSARWIGVFSFFADGTATSRNVALEGGRRQLTQTFLFDISGGLITQGASAGATEETTASPAVVAVGTDEKYTSADRPSQAVNMSR